MKHKVAMPEAANTHKKIVSKKHQIFIESFYVSFLDEKKKMFFSLYKTDRIKKNTKKTQVESCRWMLSSWVLNQQQDVKTYVVCFDISQIASLRPNGRKQLNVLFLLFRILWVENSLHLPWSQKDDEIFTCLCSINCKKFIFKIHSLCTTWKATNDDGIIKSFEFF